MEGNHINTNCVLNNQYEKVIYYFQDFYIFQISWFYPKKFITQSLFFTIYYLLVYPVLFGYDTIGRC